MGKRLLERFSMEFFFVFLAEAVKVPCTFVSRKFKYIEQFIMAFKMLKT